MNFHIYILHSKKLNKYYTGQTNDLEDRLYRHNAGQEQFTSKGVPWKLVWSKEVATRAEAVALEHQIKKRGAKRYLIDIGAEG
jgi:putative endonuclease